MRQKASRNPGILFKGLCIDSFARKHSPWALTKEQQLKGLETHSKTLSCVA